MGWLADLLQEIPLSAALKSKLDKLEAEHEQLKSDLAKAQEENKKLQQRLEKSQSGPLSDEEEAIIKLLATGPNGGIPGPAIARQLGMHQTRVEHFMHRLYEANYIGMSGNYGTGLMTYFLYPKGKEHAVSRGYV